MSSFLASTAHYIRLVLGRGRMNSDGQRRYVHIARGMSSGLAAKGVAFIVSFISVPLTVRYLGGERYGAWVTISTATAWIALADFGLSSSLTNAVSEGYAGDNHELAGDYVAAAFWSLAGIAVLLSALFFPFWRIVPWQRVFNVESMQARAEIGSAVAVAFVIFVLNFPFSIIAKIYGAYQQVAQANAWNTAGNALSLVALVLATQLKGGLGSLVIAVSGSILFINIVSAAWLFGWSKPWLFPNPRRVTRTAVKKLTSLGGMFFLIQMAALVLFQTDNLIIAHFLGAAAVTPYSVTWRLFTYTMIFQIVAAPSYWPAFAEAFARGDKAWVRRSYSANFKITVASSLVLVIPLIFFGQWIISKWAGSAAVPSFSLLLWMGVWSVIYGAMSSQSCLLASAGRIRAQAVYASVAAGVNLILSIILVQRLGLTGVIMGTIVAFLVCVVVPQSLDVKRSVYD